MLLNVFDFGEVISKETFIGVVNLSQEIFALYLNLL